MTAAGHENREASLRVRLDPDEVAKYTGGEDVLYGQPRSHQQGRP